MVVGRGLLVAAATANCGGRGTTGTTSRGAEQRNGSYRRGKDEIVAGGETRRQVNEVLDVVLERDASHALAGERVLDATHHQTQIDVRVGVAIELVELATGGEQLDLELMLARLRHVQHEHVRTVQIVVEVSARVTRLEPVRADLAYRYVVEVLEQVLVGDPEASVVLVTVRR